MDSGPRASHRDWVAQNPETVLRIIVGIYLALGMLYALLTPAWQVFDEPAHFNYVRYVADRRQLPVLQSGDLPATYLAQLQARGFPPEMSIEPLQYESHQPPLYYILAAMAYRLMLPLGIAMPLGLRAFSVLLGMGAIVIAYKLVRAIYDHDPLPALGTAAFAAMLPMHVATTAAVNNEVLVELLLNLTMWRLVTMGQRSWTVRQSFVLGALLGLSLLSGVSAYVIAGVMVVAWVWDGIRAHREGDRRFPWRALDHGVILFATATAITLPWLVHSVQAYGIADPLGIGRRNQIAASLPTTIDYIAEHGWPVWLRDMALTTFHSFWGQFGWMSLALDRRIYALLALASSLVVVHLALYVWDMARHRVHLAPHMRRALVLCALWGLLTLAGYFWQNSRFVQFQGRFLFPALAVWGLGCTLGLRKLSQNPPSFILALLALVIIILFGYSIAIGNYRAFDITAIALVMVLIGLGHWLQSRAHSAPLVLAYLGMGILALVCLFRYILPALP